jgi:release factor glutamine methyltransferase
VYAEDEARLIEEAAASERGRDALAARREAGEPLEQVLGWADFCGVRVVLAPGVFVPRRRSALVVEEAVRLAPDVVVDLCCGSGAIGLAIAHRLPGVEVHAADLRADAADCARANLAVVGGRVYRGDLYDALPHTVRGRADVIAVNPPYVPTDAVALMPTEARDHEPRDTLDGGPDGLGVVRRIVAGAGRWLTPRGAVVLESSRDQAAVVAAIMAEDGFTARVERDDDLDATIVVGHRSGAAPGLPRPPS